METNPQFQLVPPPLQVTLAWHAPGACICVFDSGLMVCICPAAKDLVLRLRKACKLRVCVCVLGVSGHIC
jgi:hypothetical protein